MPDQKHVLVLGAGVIGITTAYYLARQGYRVSIIDRAEDVASESSHANAGTLSSYHAQSWANPGAPGNFLAGFRRKDSIFRMRLRSDRSFLIWCALFLRYCLPGATKSVNAELRQLVCETQDMLRDVMAELPLEHLGTQSITQGGLYLFNQDEDLINAKNKRPDDFTSGYARMLSREELMVMEPSLSNAKHHFVGAVAVDRDYSADCFAFTKALSDYLRQNMAVDFMLGESINDIIHVGNTVGVRTQNKEITADRIVICLGANVSILTRKLGFDPYVYPVKGYSISIPILGKSAVPHHFAVDDHSFIAYSTLGNVFRLASFVEFAGFDKTIDAAAIQHLRRYAMLLAPDGLDKDQFESHACLRPMTPSGGVIVRQIPGHKNIWINAGHGHKGWGICCATANQIALSMAEKEMIAC